MLVERPACLSNSAWSPFPAMRQSLQQRADLAPLLPFARHLRRHSQYNWTNDSRVARAVTAAARARCRLVMLGVEVGGRFDSATTAALLRPLATGLRQRNLPSERIVLPRRPRPPKPNPCRPLLKEAWSAGCRNFWNMSLFARHVSKSVWKCK